MILDHVDVASGEIGDDDEDLGLGTKKGLMGGPNNRIMAALLS